VKIHHCYYFWKRQGALAPWNSHHNQLCPGPFDKPCHGAQSYDLNAEKSFWKCIGYGITAGMGSITIFNMHTHFSQVTETAGRSQLYLPSLAVAVYLSPTKAARELAMAHMSLSGACQ